MTHEADIDADLMTLRAFVYGTSAVHALDRLTTALREADAYELAGTLENARYWHARAERAEAERDGVWEELDAQISYSAYVEAERDRLREALERIASKKTGVDAAFAPNIARAALSPEKALESFRADVQRIDQPYEEDYEEAMRQRRLCPHPRGSKECFDYHVNEVRCPAPYPDTCSGPEFDPKKHTRSRGPG